MLLDLLIDAGSAVRDTLFGRMMRRLDQTLLMMAELDERTKAAAARAPGHRATRPQARALRHASQPSSLPSMTARPEAMTSAPAI